MKIAQTSLSESVTQHLAERILCGELPAGSVLPGENELATVSRGGWTPPSQNKSLAKDIVTVAQFTIFTLQRLSDADVQRWWVHHHRPRYPTHAGCTPDTQSLRCTANLWDDGTNCCPLGVIFALIFQNHTNCPLTDFGGKTSIFSHPVYLFLREFSLQDFRGASLSY